MIRSKQKYVGFAAALIAAVLFAIGGGSVFTPKPVPDASAANSLTQFTVQNVTKSNEFKVDYLNDYKGSAGSYFYTKADKVCGFTPDVVGKYLIVTDACMGNCSGRTIAVVAPDESGTLKVTKLDTGDKIYEYKSDVVLDGSEGTQLVVSVPEGGYVLVGHGAGATRLTEGFAVGDEVGELKNHLPYRLIDKTLGMELMVTEKNTGGANGSVVVTTSAHSGSIELAQYHGGFTVELADGKYKVKDVKLCGAADQVFTIPEGGFAVDANGDIVDTDYNASCFMGQVKAGDEIEWTDTTLTLKTCDINVNGTTTVDGIDPEEQGVSTTGKIVIYTNAYNGLKTLARPGDDAVVEYAVDGTGKVSVKKETSGTAIPWDGYVLSMPADKDINAQVGDALTLSGADAEIPERQIVADNVTGNKRFTIGGKNKANAGDDVILLNDMLGNKCVAGWYWSVAVTPDESGKLTAGTPVNLNGSTQLDIPAGGFVLSAHGSMTYVIQNMSAGDEIVLHDLTAGALTAADATIAVGSTVVTAEGIDPAADSDTLGKVLLYSSKTGSMLTKARKDTSVLEVAIDVLPSGHVVSAVYEKTGNVIPSHGYIVSIPATLADFAAVKTAFVKDAAVTFDKKTTTIDFPDITADNTTQNIRVVVRSIDPDQTDPNTANGYIGHDACVFTKGTSGPNAYASDVFVVNGKVTEVKDSLVQVKDEESQEENAMKTVPNVVPENGFILGGQGDMRNVVKLFKTGDDVTINNYPADNDVSVAGIKLDGDAFEAYNAEQQNYIVRLPKGTKTVPVVTAEAKYEGQKVTVTVATAIPGDTKIAVVSRNGKTTATITISFSFELSKDTTLSAISIGGKPLDGFKAGTTKYTVWLDYGSAYPTVTVTTTDSAATATVTQATAETQGKATIRVAAEDAENYQATYEIAFLIADTTLSGITVAGTPIEGFDPDKTDYTVELAAGTSIETTATATDKDATVKVTYADDGSEVTIAVSSHDFTRTYTVKITVRSEKKKGCGSAVVGGGLAFVALLGAGLIAARKRRG